MRKESAIITLPRDWIVDYSQARERAIRWLGDRYLLAREVKRLPHVDKPARLAAGKPPG